MAIVLPVPPTNEELLSQVEIAISTTLQTGKSVTFNGRTYTANDLPDLWQMRRDLLALTAGITGGYFNRVAAYDKGL